MTAKDYVKLANSLSAAGEVVRQTAWMTEEQAGKVHAFYVGRIADVLAMDNPRFNREVFFAHSLADMD